MYKFAHAHGVKYLLTGANFSTECIRNPIEWMYYQSDDRQLRDIHKKHGSGKLNKFPTTSILHHKIYLRYIKRLKVLRPLNHIDYFKDDAMSLLEREIGWQRYPQNTWNRGLPLSESYRLPETVTTLAEFNIQV